MSGTVTFDLVPFSANPALGLNYAAITQAPAREVTVEAYLESFPTAALVATQTDASGNYSLTVPANTNIFLMVKAEMVRAGSPGWTFRVRDNVVSPDNPTGDALYALRGAVFSTGTTALTRNLNAPSGWGGASYTGVRSSGPFAVLDAVYEAKQLVLSGGPAAEFPELNIFWSPDNVTAPGTGVLEEDIRTGNLETTFYLDSTPAAMYVLGEDGVDTDEFDRHVLAHEWGHYYQDSFSRDDSIGGEHSPIDRLDPRVAFSEGWADAFSGMALGDSLYRDSFYTGQAMAFAVDMETYFNATSSRRGWFSEGSIAPLIYDLFDSASDTTLGVVDNAQVSFASLHSAMMDLADTDALTGIHPFLNRLRALEPTQLAAIDAISNRERIRPGQPDDFAALENNPGGLNDTLPIYKIITTSGTPVTVCPTGSTDPFNVYNMHGNNMFLRLTVPTAQTLTISVAAASSDPADNPDVVVHRRGIEIAINEDDGPSSTGPLALDAGDYVIETYHFETGRRCINVTVAP